MSATRRLALRRSRELPWETLGLPAVVVLMILLFGALAPNFWAVSNASNVARQVAVLGMIGAVQTVVIISGGIDLSVGSVLAVANVLMAMGLAQGSVALGAVLALGAGLGFGLLNGVLIGRTRLAPFIVTLGMLSIARGTALTITDGVPIFGLPESSFSWIGQGYLGPVPAPVIFAVITFAAIGVLLSRTSFGTTVYAIGGNEQAAVLAGMRVARTKIAIYALSGLTAALGGVILTARVNSGQPLLGQGLELDSVATVVIGGTYLFGGRGRLVGTIFGVMFVGILQNGLNLLGISTFVQQVVIGASIIVAVLLTVWRARA
ncbi:MAG: ABC transporter permease [Chloroflexi bacterium]|nr:ABC transporter permease [Chloroflexota bacterium]